MNSKFYIVFLFLINIVLGQAQTNKIERFKEEIYHSKKVIVPYKVNKIENFPDSLNMSIKKVTMYNSYIDSLLYLYLSNENINEHLLIKEKTGYGFLYLKDKNFFDVFKNIVNIEQQIDEKLSDIINENSNLARITIYYKDKWIFSDAFIVAKGYKGFANIDHFRIKESISGRVLKYFEHGDVISEKESYYFGYFENNVTYQITVPIIFKKIYLADIKYTFYK